MSDKMAISAYILKIVENDPFLRFQMRANEDFSRHQFFYRLTPEINQSDRSFIVK